MQQPVFQWITNTIDLSLQTPNYLALAAKKAEVTDVYNMITDEIHCYQIV